MFGKNVLRTLLTKDGWEGIVVGKSKVKYQAPTEHELVQKLEAATLANEPHFVGKAGALQLFQNIFPLGFSDPAYIGDKVEGERKFKQSASEDAQQFLPFENASKMDNCGPIALKLFQKTLLLDPNSKIRLANILRGPEAPHLLEIIKAFASGHYAEACAEGVARFGNQGVFTWPILTYLPFLWFPDEHMFLKPEFTKEYARRIGHRFAIDYVPTPNAETYLGLLDLASETGQLLKDLNPKDNIDIHSFMWVVIKYTTADIAEIHLRMSDSSPK